MRSAPQRHDVSIDHHGKPYRGFYTVESGVLSLWTMTEDGAMLGPMAIVLRTMPQEAAAKMLLQQYADSGPVTIPRVR